MMTKKLLVAFDPKKPDQRSNDFLIVLLEGAQPKLLGVRSKKPTVSVLMVYLGKEITANDLFAKWSTRGEKSRASNKRWARWRATFRNFKTSVLEIL